MNKHDINNEASVGIYISTFLGTVALFFAGILISKFENFDTSLKVPILFLIVATFGFVFSAVIYANLTGLSRIKMQDQDKYIKVGNSISEYLGLYPFIASIPMVVAAITEDSFLRISTLVITSISILLYTVSKFSLLSRGFSRITVTLLGVVITLILDVTVIIQKNNQPFFSFLGLCFLGLMVLLTIIESDKL